jgi:hypothetical protein
MIPNHYDHEWMAQAHHQDLLREAEHERLGAQLSQPRRRTPLHPAQLILFLHALRMRLQHRFQRRSA